MDQTTGNSIAPQQIKSTKMKISVHVRRSISPSSLSSMIISAVLARIWNTKSHRHHSGANSSEKFMNRAHTCKEITMMNSFLSLSANMCLINVQPVPIRTIVMNSTAPFNLAIVDWRWKKLVRIARDASSALLTNA